MWVTTIRYTIDIFFPKPNLRNKVLAEKIFLYVICLELKYKLEN